MMSTDEMREVMGCARCGRYAGGEHLCGNCDHYETYMTVEELARRFGEAMAADANEKTVMTARECLDLATECARFAERDEQDASGWHKLIHTFEDIVHDRRLAAMYAKAVKQAAQCNADGDLNYGEPWTAEDILSEWAQDNERENYA